MPGPGIAMLNPALHDTQHVALSRSCAGVACQTVQYCLSTAHLQACLRTHATANRGANSAPKGRTLYMQCKIDIVRLHTIRRSWVPASPAWHNCRLNLLTVDAMHDNISATGDNNKSTCLMLTHFPRQHMNTRCCWGDIGSEVKYLHRYATNNVTNRKHTTPQPCSGSPAKQSKASKTPW